MKNKNLIQRFFMYLKAIRDYKNPTNECFKNKDYQNDSVISRKHLYKYNFCAYFPWGCLLLSELPELNNLRPHLKERWLRNSAWWFAPEERIARLSLLRQARNQMLVKLMPYFFKTVVIICSILLIIF